VQVESRCIESKITDNIKENTYNNKNLISKSDNNMNNNEIVEPLEIQEVVAETDIDTRKQQIGRKDITAIDLNKNTEQNKAPAGKEKINKSIKNKLDNKINNESVDKTNPYSKHYNTRSKLQAHCTSVEQREKATLTGDGLEENFETNNKYYNNQINNTDTRTHSSDDYKVLYKHECSLADTEESHVEESCFADWSTFENKNYYLSFMDGAIIQVNSDLPSELEIENVDGYQAVTENVPKSFYEALKDELWGDPARLELSTQRETKALVLTNKEKYWE
jgi:hypothetical protein